MLRSKLCDSTRFTFMRLAPRELGRPEKSRGQYSLELARDERGLTTVEMVILLCLVAVVGIASWRGFSTTLKQKIGAGTSTIASLSTGDGATSSGSPLPALPAPPKSPRRPAPDENPGVLSRAASAVGSALSTLGDLIVPSASAGEFAEYGGAVGGVGGLGGLGGAVRKQVGGAIGMLGSLPVPASPTDDWSHLGDPQALAAVTPARDAANAASEQARIAEDNAERANAALVRAQNNLGIAQQSGDFARTNAAQAVADVAARRAATAHQALEAANAQREATFKAYRNERVRHGLPWGDVL